MICAVAGMTADANILINFARQAAQRYLLTYNEDIPCEQLVRRLCDLKQGYTQHGGLRPFGVSFIYAGYDHVRQFQLYQSNPSGNYGGWKATSVGANNASAQSILKQDYKEDCDLKDACALAVKVLSKTMDSNKLSSEKSEMLPQNYPPYHALPCPTMPYPTLPCPTLLYQVLPYSNMPYPTLPYPTSNSGH